MQEKYFKLEIITPFQIIYQNQVRHVRIPGTEGYFGVLAGHAPFIATLQIGEIKVESDRETKYFAISGGIVEVLPYSTTVLVETAEEANQIDISRAQSAKMRAKSQLKNHAAELIPDQEELALKRAENRLKISHTHNQSPT
jgi:F-type H+-transporting ATPase subunit epsilon